MKEDYRYTKRDLDREFKRGASRGRELQKHEDISEFLEDLKWLTPDDDQYHHREIIIANIDKAIETLYALTLEKNIQ